MCCAMRNMKYFIMLQLSFSGLSDWQVCSTEDSSSVYPFDKALRTAKEEKTSFVMKTGGPPLGLLARRNRTKLVRRRTTPLFVSRPDYCDHMAKPCLHAYVTGKICGKGIERDHYITFDNYCMMEYVNCREGMEMFQMVYVGECILPTPMKDYVFYPYGDDKFLDNYYILGDKTNPYFY